MKLSRLGLLVIVNWINKQGSCMISRMKTEPGVIWTFGNIRPYSMHDCHEFIVGIAIKSRPSK